MKRSIVAALLGFVCAVSASGQENAATTPLQITSRAVLVDVVVTDSSGNPVTGLSKDAFTVTDQGRPQAITFFEEHGMRPVPATAMPKMPPDVFSNFSPFSQPPAVNVLLLDSLNTAMTYQVSIDSEVMKFLKSAKPGMRSAIFVMGRRLRLMQGFTDDPAALSAALENAKNIWVEPPTMMKSQVEADTQKELIQAMSQQVDPHGATLASPEMTAALQSFYKENDTSQSSARMLVTLANLKELAAFLQGVPGRKNIIWFAQKVPAAFNVEGCKLQLGNPAIGDEIRQTIAMLTAERAAIYPVGPRGLQAPGGVSDTVDCAADRNSDRLNAQILAEQSGGKAFANTNGIADVIEKITSDSGHFYTLSYSPKHIRMDGSFRKIKVMVAGGSYHLSYRRGYFVVDSSMFGGAVSSRKPGTRQGSENRSGAADPLLQYMVLGSPQSEQILYKIRIVPVAPEKNDAGGKRGRNHYTVDFAVDLGDLDLKSGADGTRKGALVVSLIVYDWYGNILSSESHLADLHIQPDAYAVFARTGLQLHNELAVPSGDCWLRTGIYDPNSHKVGTLEIPLSAVKPM